MSFEDETIKDFRRIPSHEEKEEEIGECLNCHTKDTTIGYYLNNVNIKVCKECAKKIYTKVVDRVKNELESKKK